MNKIFRVFFVSILVISLTVPAFADDAIKKLGRGLANIITSPLEVTAEIQEVNRENGMFAAVTWGMLKGFIKGFVRLGVGVYEVISFPVPFPEDYGPILADPEFYDE